MTNEAYVEETKVRETKESEEANYRSRRMVEKIMNSLRRLISDVDNYKRYYVLLVDTLVFNDNRYEKFSRI